VPVAQLEKFARLAKEMTKGQMGYMNATKERIGKVADRYNIPRELIMENYDFGAATEDGGAGSGSGVPSMSQGGDWITLSGGLRIREKK
jgi:hypothetical protein